MGLSTVWINYKKKLIIHPFGMKSVLAQKIWFYRKKRTRDTVLSRVLFVNWSTVRTELYSLLLLFEVPKDQSSSNQLLPLSFVFSLSIGSFFEQFLMNIYLYDLYDYVQWCDNIIFLGFFLKSIVRPEGLILWFPTKLISTIENERYLLCLLKPLLLSFLLLQL